MTALDQDVETAATPLSVAMREGSRAQHDAAEAATFIADLMGGKVNEYGYVNYLRALRDVYAALEETSRELADHPVVALIHDTQLERLGAIEADIAAWSTGAPEETVFEGRSVQGYVDSIRAAKDNPVRLVAHLYTRYMGDLSGGLAIGRILDREFSREGNGLSFYAFEHIAKPKEYKDGYRAALDSLPLDEAERAEVVEEVQVAFAHNQAIFAELGEHLEHFHR
ncbi:MAG: heme oxygenase (biliverdin-producing) [Nocardioides sp.]|uniref:biliverdin-producing heme oxygenase n=1 Tax=Nocardioides sp. TaxID=35761 RepID=UPI003F0F4A42